MIDELAGPGFDILHAAFAEGPPAGVDLRTDHAPNSLYQRLRDARSEARARERKEDSPDRDDPPPPPDWRLVQQLAVEALSQKSKDLEIAAWLTEALLRLDEFRGLATGLRLMQNLVQDFWAFGLYPQEDEDGISTRVAPIAGLSGQGAEGTLIQPLRKRFFLKTGSSIEVRFFDYAASESLEDEQNPETRQRREKAGNLMRLELIEREARSAPLGWFAKLQRDLRTADAAWSALGETVQAVAGPLAPSTKYVTDRLQEFLKIVARYAPEEEIVAPVPLDTTSDAAVDPATDATTQAGRASAEPATRDDMLRELARIAAFFRRTEPHSPLAYTLDDAVRRGRMSLPDLLAEIVPDRVTREQMLLQLGIKPAST